MSWQILFSEFRISGFNEFSTSKLIAVGPSKAFVWLPLVHRISAKEFAGFIYMHKHPHMGIVNEGIEAVFNVARHIRSIA